MTDLPWEPKKAGLAADWVFGYGSIMNNQSRATTTTTCNNNNNNAAPGAEDSASGVLLARLKPSFGMVRCWNFRSLTGFTAVGLRERAGHEPLAPVVGVLFAASGSMAAFDERERGYERLALQLDDLDFGPLGSAAPGEHHQAQLPLQEALRHAILSASPPRLWVYVPSASSSHAPSEDFPICQTYVDTVLQGCLAWGGLALAQEWVTTTFGWSPYFLNDAPLSRRPWLHRQRHAEIDSVLSQHAEWTRSRERRHPEEFASHWMSGLRGMWGVPPRNRNFVGREQALANLKEALRSARDGKEEAPGITIIETVGLGGVGKTQMAVEYCHRHYQAADDKICSYGLVVWLNAEFPDSIAAGFRQLAADSGLVVKDMHNEEIVAEMCSRLYRTGCPWLLVFDNVEDRGVLQAYLPRGGFRAGHVLVTTRHALPGMPSDRRVSLDCFCPEESVDFLRQAAGDHALHPAGETTVGRLVADALGHLPLALAMAAAYMAHCDATCAEYLERLRSSDTSAILSIDSQKLSGYPMGFVESLLLSLRQMGQEEARLQDELQGAAGGRISARAVLGCLCFLAPDSITKSLMRLLVQELRQAALVQASAQLATGAGSVASGALGATLLLRPRQELESLACCILALRKAWAFDPADTNTWPEAGTHLEHVKAVGQHLDELLRNCAAAGRPLPVSSAQSLDGAAVLLTEAALYLSMALSRFDEANAALETATRLGVLRLKQLLPEAAEALLRESLQMKRSLRGTVCNTKD
ncbi:unnamed protein product [Polarella glacialis]|uniref:NB-ARC domain-containing protein n=1 Tax=Polarella glacialis TaxID=89957 RepID=A0A813HP23_POLGL|nr:unnamed protein product [Polarella glacialis]